MSRPLLSSRSAPCRCRTRAGKRMDPYAARPRSAYGGGSRTERVLRVEDQLAPVGGVIQARLGVGVAVHGGALHPRGPTLVEGAPERIAAWVDIAVIDVAPPHPEAHVVVRCKIRDPGAPGVERHAHRDRVTGKLDRRVGGEFKIARPGGSQVSVFPSRDVGSPNAVERGLPTSV